ncbi:MAG: hypothetical protein KAG20_07830 [Cocleimonas sp.]|nr:hypothetical protein [Cocleimonas sp.]
MSNLKKSGGDSRQKIILSDIVAFAKKELVEIESLSIKQSPKTKRFTRLAKSIKMKLRGDKRKFGKGKIKPIALSTYHSYLTDIRNELKALDIKHHSLAPTVKRLSKLYPEYADLFADIEKEPALSVGAVKAEVMSLIQDDKMGANRTQAYSAVKMLKVDHDVVTRLVKSDVEKADRAQNEADSLRNKKQNAVTINHKTVENIIDAMIKSKAYSKRALGLAMATGRRSIEILFTGDFKATGSNTVMFSGQAKKRYGTDTEEYQIYTLIPADKFVKAFKSFRNMKVVKDIHEKANKEAPSKRNTFINMRVSKTLNEATRRAFDDSKRVYKDSRAIYTRICLDKFFANDKEWKTKDEDEFLKSLLGHSDYKDQRNYKQFKIDYSELKEEVVSEDRLEQIASNISILDELDEKVFKSNKRAMVALHERVKAWAVNNPEWSLSQTVMTKPKGVGKIGGSRKLIKEYLIIAQGAIDKYNANK